MVVVNAGRLNEKTTRTNIWTDANRLERGKKLFGDSRSLEF